MSFSRMMPRSFQPGAETAARKPADISSMERAKAERSWHEAQLILTFCYTATPCLVSFRRNARLTYIFNPVLKDIEVVRYARMSIYIKAGNAIIIFPEVYKP